MRIPFRLPSDLTLSTQRLLLRPFAVTDAERVVVIQSNWEVARMVRMAEYPPNLAAIRDWLAAHRDEWVEGSAYRFAIVRAGEVIGCADLDAIAAGHGSIGYWLAKEAWGQGLATEAAARIVVFAFKDLGLDCLLTGHSRDNPASGAVLLKLGFQFVGEEERWSRPRGEMITQRLYRLEAE